MQHPDQDFKLIFKAGNQVLGTTEKQYNYVEKHRIGLNAIKMSSKPVHFVCGELDFQHFY